MATQTISKLSVTSSAFKQEGDIPAKYTCQGQDISPALQWSAGPAGTQSYALIMDDPDAPGGTYVHWLAWNLTGTTLAENQPKGDSLSGGGINGTNSWKKTGYGGPCPPSGTHRYYFKVYALDTKLNLKPSTTKQQLLDAMKDHIVGQGELMGKYAKT